MSKQIATEFGVKSQLAKLLATENITLEHRPGIPTAWFDVKSRVLTLPVWKGISEDLYDMLVVHEVGHALDTPADGWVKAIKTIAKKHHVKKEVAEKAEVSIKNFLNVVEDARIDKRQKRRYPGSKRNFVHGYAELHKRNFFGIEGQNINALSFIDRANIYFKGGLSMNITFSEDEKVFIERMEKAETFEEVVEITSDIYEFARQNNQTSMSTSQSGEESDEEGEEGEEGEGKGKKSKKSKSSKNKKPSSGKKNKNKSDSKGDGADEDEDDDSSGGEGDEDGSGSDADGDDDADGDGNGSGDDGNGDEDGDADSNGDAAEGDDDGDGSDADADSDGSSDGDGTSAPTKKSIVGGGTFSGDYIPQSVTEEWAAQAVEDIVLDIDANYIYTITPKYDISKIVDDYSVVIPQMKNAIRAGAMKQTYQASFKEWKAREKDTISYMVKEFEMRKAADTHARINISKTGVLDTNKLHSYKFNDDIFRRMATIPEGKNHGFVMILDWSGSMNDNLQKTLCQLFSLVMFCRRIQIPFDVYLFRTSQYGETVSGQFDTSAPGSLICTTFKLRNVLSSRMNTMMFNDAMETLWIGANTQIGSDVMGSTPLNQSLLVLDQIVNNFQKKNRVQIVSTIILTDGASDAVYGYQGENHYLPTKKGGNKYFLRDHVTGKIYNLPSHPRSSYKGMTTVLTHILKDRTNCNLIGFYLHNSDYASLEGAQFMTKEEAKDPANKKSWEENGFVGVSSLGYDEYYLMSIGRTSQRNEQFTTTRKGADNIADAFIKFVGKKAVNRILLSRFVKRISDFKKRA